jgi:hypothetical protein
VAWASDLCEHLLRTVTLLALTIAPTSLSPEPRPPEQLVAAGIAAGCGLALLLYGARRFQAWIDTTRARVAGALVWIAVAAALAAALVYRGAEAPLARGIPVMAIPVWGALAAVASAAADHLLGSNWKHKRLAPIVLVLAAGVLQLSNTSKLLESPRRMWWAALRRDPGHTRAARELVEPLLRAGKHAEARDITERCLKLDPQSRPCLDLRAEVELRARSEGAADAPAGAVRPDPSARPPPTPTSGER